MFFGRSISLKQGLLMVVLAALLPITVTSVLQSIANWRAMQNAAMATLGANAKAVAERERDAFLVSNRLLMVGSANPDIRNMTNRCDAVLRTGFRGHDPVINFVRTDASGRARCSIIPFREGLSFVGEPWWEDTKKSRVVTVSQPTFGTVSRKPLIISALAVLNDKGEFDGTISAGLDISRLARSISDAPEARTGVIAIISRSGNLVASDTDKMPFAVPPGLSAGSSGVIRTQRDEKWVYETVELSGGDLFVLYAEPRARIMKAALTQFRASIIMPLVTILLTVCAIWFGTNRLVIRWLTRLRQLSEEFTKGNFSGNRTAFATAPSELRGLSDDLHTMAAVIDSRTAELTAALDTKTKLTREVHHRVKNNLQIVTSLLTMQASRVTDDAAQTALKQSRARIIALALIHRLSYEQENDSAEPSVTVETLMGELCKQLRYAHRENQNVDLSFRADDYSLPVDSAVPLALFIVEAVTNCFRHAFPTNAPGKIEMTFALVGDKAILSIEDNGQGYDVNAGLGRNMGTQLMQGFASQLNGTVTFISDHNMGSSTTLHFPVTVLS